MTATNSVMSAGTLEENNSSDFVLSNADIGEDLIAEQTSQAQISVQAFAAQVTEGNAAIMQKLREENSELKTMLESRIHDYRKHLNEIADYKARTDKTIEKVKAEKQDLEAQKLDLIKQNYELGLDLNDLQDAEMEYRLKIEQLENLVRSNQYYISYIS